MTIFRVVKKKQTDYPTSDRMCGHTYATNGLQVYVVANTREVNGERVFKLIPVIGSKGICTRLDKEFTRSELLDSYEIYTATDINDSKKLLKQLIA